MTEAMFDVTPGGIVLRDLGMRRAEQAEPSWTVAAAAWIARLRPGTRFTAEAMTAAVGLPRGEAAQNRNNAVGAVIAGASRGRLIARVGFTQATRPESHARMVAEWLRVAS